MEFKVSSKSSGGFNYYEVVEGKTLKIPEFTQHFIFGDMVVDGDIIMDGDLVIYDSEELIFGRKRNITTITSSDSPYTVTTNDDFIEVDATSGNIIINFLLASDGGTNFSLARKDNSANTVTLNRAGGDTLAGDTSLTMNSQYEIIEWQSNGVDTWY